MEPWTRVTTEPGVAGEGLGDSGLEGGRMTCGATGQVRAAQRVGGRRLLTGEDGQLIAQVAPLGFEEGTGVMGGQTHQPFARALVT